VVSTVFPRIVTVAHSNMHLPETHIHTSHMNLQLLSTPTHTSIIQEWNMGQRASNTAGVTFEDVVVPNEVSTTTPEYEICC